MADIPFIQEDLIHNPVILQAIRENYELDLYWTDNWSSSFYSKLAFEGFISTCLFDKGLGQHVLLPEMQRAYAVLDWENLHIPRNIQKKRGRLTQYSLRIHRSLDKLSSSIRQYHPSCWLTLHYQKLLEEINRETPTVSVISVELQNPEMKTIAGELGYIIGRTYTSLTGFSNRISLSPGTVQMIALARILEIKGMAFWNLGHPQMEYKTRLGARILERKDFLERWTNYRNGTAVPLEGIYPLGDIL